MPPVALMRSSADVIAQEEPAAISIELSTVAHFAPRMLAALVLHMSAKKKTGKLVLNYSQGHLAGISWVEKQP